jgi:serine/threonine protein kinase
VAIKKLTSETTKDREDFMAEYTILKNLHHPHLVKVYGVCIERNPFLLILEFLEKGSLKSYLKNHARQETTFEDLINIGENIFRQIDKTKIY